MIPDLAAASLNQMPPKKKGKSSPPKDWYSPDDTTKRKRVSQAISALEAGEERVTIIDETYNQLAYETLDIISNDPNEILDWALTLLHEIRDADPVKCFATGGVQRCKKHKGFGDLYLFPYKISSQYFKKTIWIKFGIRTRKTEKGKQYHYCHLNLHIDAPEKIK